MLRKKPFSSYDPLDLQCSWRLVPLFLSLAFLSLIFFSWLSPFTFPFWQGIDTAVFRLLNTPLASNKFLQIFWAIANHHRTNFLHDFVLFFLFWGFVRALSPLRKKVFFAKMLLFIGIHITCVAYISKNFVGKTLEYHRTSPSLVLEDAILLQEKIPYLKIKDGANISFPSDHGTTALAFCFLCFYFLRGKKRFFGVTYFLFFSLPRLAVGAHWFSDIYVGSFVFLYVFYAVFIYTPLLNLLSSTLLQTLFSKPFMWRNFGVRIQAPKEIPEPRPGKQRNLYS